MNGDNLKENLRPAIKSPMPSVGDGRFGKDGRRVNFPADDSLVTGYLEPPNPWEKALNVTSEELVHVYKTSCEDHHIKPINKVIQQLQDFETVGNRVESLSLKGEKLDSRHFEAMEEIFKRVQFHTIDVESTNLDDDTAVALFDMVEYYESASNLNISHNKNLSLRAWQACARMLKKARCLESLIARNNHVSEHFMSALNKTFRSGCNLTALHLEMCNISGRSCSSLMMALKMNTSIRELYLADNKLSSLDALQIGNLLRSNTRLKLLDLRCNHVTDAGVGHIVDGLCDQSMGPGEGLQTLVLWSNQLTCNSAAYFCKAVSTSKTLQTLNIGNNNITNEGIFCLKDALIKNYTLKHLGVQQAKITCEGAISLAEYIAENSCIQTIDLRENVIKVAGLLALSLSMKVNRSITRLDLDKDPKKETQKELQDQHQRLLIEIMECCENNHQTNLKLCEEEERERGSSITEDTEQLSESVCRLLSIFEPRVKTKSPNSKLTNGITARTDAREVSSSPPINPVILLPENESSSSSTSSISLTLCTPPVTVSSPVNPGLLSPPTTCPSPPKSRFRVSRVLLDSDSLLASAGSTPMPSPVPSPGHTPFPSPLCTPLPSPICSPFPSPLSSPMGSPLSSPFRNGFANGMISYPSSVVVSKVNPSKSNLVGDPIKKRVLRPRNNSPVISVTSVPENVIRTSRSFFTVTPAEPIGGHCAPPPSLASDHGSSSDVSTISPSSVSSLSDTISTSHCEVPPNTPEERSEDASSWVEDASDLSELQMSCGSESWVDSLSDGLLSGGSSPTSESCPSLSSYSNITPLTSPTPNVSISTVEEFRDPSETSEASDVTSIADAPVLISPVSNSSVLATDDPAWSVVSADSGVATPDSELSSASSSMSCLVDNNSLSSDVTVRLGTLAPPSSPAETGLKTPPTSPMTSALLQFPKKGVASSNSLYSPIVTCKRSLSPSASQVEFSDTGQSGVTTLELPDTQVDGTSPTSPAKPFRKKKKTEDAAEVECSNSAPSSSKTIELKLAEPSCVRLFGGGEVSPAQPKDCNFFVKNTMTDGECKEEIEGNEEQRKCDEEEVQKISEEVQEFGSVSEGVEICGSSETKECESEKGGEDDEEVCSSRELPSFDDGSEAERRHQIEDLKRSLEDAKVFISRRASTGSFPAGRLVNKKEESIFRRLSMTVDELIQKQLIELHSNSKMDKREEMAKCNEQFDDDDQKTGEDEDGGKIMTDDENENEIKRELSAVTVQIDDEYCVADIEEKCQTNFNVCHQTPEEVFSAIIHRDETNAQDELRLMPTEGRPIAVRIEMKSPIRQRLIASGTCGESSTSPLRACIEEVVMSPQCRSIDANDILHLFDDYEDGLPKIETSGVDILAMASQESAPAAETLKT